MKSQIVLVLALSATVWADTSPKNVSPSDWAQIQTEHTRHKQAILPVPGGHHARNLAQQWTTSFDGRHFEVQPDSGQWKWGLELQSYGFAGNQRLARRATTTTRVEKLAYTWDAVLSEWFVNGKAGLEHGYTLAARPGIGSGPLLLDLKVIGNLLPRASGNGRNLTFFDHQGQPRLNYDGLKVIDAAGHSLIAAFVVEGETLRLKIDESSAKYPILIDPVATQQAYLKASNSATTDQFGASVAISGDTIVVGATEEDGDATTVNGSNNNNAENAGAAYVFTRVNSVWTQQAYLKASNSGAGDNFGVSIAISGDTIVVGANREDSSSTGVNANNNNNALDAGAAYVFVRSANTWSQQAYLKASNTDAGDDFGISVSISGDTIVVGAHAEASAASGVGGDQTSNSDSGSGAAYVFTRTAGAWAQQAYLKASNNHTSSSAFGQSVAVSVDTIVVGANFESSNATGVNGNQLDTTATLSGAAYVFTRSGSNWTQQAYLKASNTAVFDLFGSSVAISGDTIVVGALNQNNNLANGAGAAYVFSRSGAVWTQQALLKASNTEIGDIFGNSVAISGDRIVVGAPLESSNATGVDGSQTNNSATSSGAAYLFTRSGSTWTQRAYLKASNTQAGDNFGNSVAISGDTVLVGALSESSNATGINGSQTDNSASRSGASYVFPLTFADVNVTVNSSRPGLLFSSSGSGCEPGASYSTSKILLWTPDSACTLSFPTPQAGVSGTRFVFNNWEDSSTNPTRAITAPTSAATYTANFRTQHLLTTAVDGLGTVSPATGFRNAGNVNVSAAPGACNAFVGWTGATVTAGQINLTGPVTLTAVFRAPIASPPIFGQKQVIAGLPVIYRHTIDLPPVNSTN